MIDPDIVWLASYPRSGNTFLRTILWQCFHLRSASVYPRDLGGNKKLEEYVGHIEHNSNNKIRFDSNAIPLIKTHECASDNNRAIYIIRDGRAACVSLWEFYNRSVPLEHIVDGEHRFGTWADHVNSWSPWDRKNTLLLKYEDMKDNFDSVLESLGEFLSLKAIRREIPDREKIVKTDGRWVRSKSDWRINLKGTLLDRFLDINGEVLQKVGYSIDE